MNPSGSDVAFTFAPVKKRILKVHSHYAFFFAICVKRKLHLTLHLTQQPIDATLQFDVNANAHANLDARVNGPLQVFAFASAFQEHVEFLSTSG